MSLKWIWIGLRNQVRIGMNQTKPHENLKEIKIQVMWIQELTYYRALQVKQNARV